MAHDVFISHSAKDKPVADATCATLEKAGIRCWIAPRDVLPGVPWGKSILDAIHGSRAIVLVFSGHADKSPQIEREVTLAVEAGIPLIPLRIENVVASGSLRYFLSTPHWLDAMTPPLERHLERLVEVVRQITASPQDATAEPPAAAERRDSVANEPPQVSPPPPSSVAASSHRRLFALALALGVAAVAVPAALYLRAHSTPAIAPLTRFRDCSDCPEMIAIPAGNFTMGSPPSEEGRYQDEGPQHRVTIAEAFALGLYDVTFAEWDACVTDGGCNGYRPSDNGWGRARRPVINVSLKDAEAYAAWLSRKTGKSYRLPSEAEWEYAARAGTTTARYWGDELGTGHANCDGCGGQWEDRETAPVGQFKPNAFGLHDMLGNVWQWTEDCWSDDYEGAPSDGSAWRPGDCAHRVVVGGSWESIAQNLRSAARDSPTADGHANNIGFRVVRTLE